MSTATAPPISRSSFVDPNHALTLTATDFVL
jgi:hypothetical protein